MAKMLALAAVTALCAAAPAAATTNHYVPIRNPVTGNVITPHYRIDAAGSVLTRGDHGAMTYFRVDMAKGPGHKLVVRDPASSMFFRALSFRTITWLPGVVKLTGVGLMNGHRVPFTATALSYNGRMLDRFGISIDHHARIGGVLQNGNIRITALSV